MPLLSALLLASALPVEPVGRIYHYVRSNSDGTEAEAVHVFRKDRTTLEVVKMRSHCTNAAYVIATLDPETWEAKTLSGGRLLPDAQREAFATLTDSGKDIEASVTMKGETVRQSVPIPIRPWHLYDFDLASLSVATAHLANPDQGFDFALALVWLDPAQPRTMLHWLGAAHARAAGATADIRRYAVEGPAFGSQGGGTLDIDARDGHIVAARFGRPNHAEYRDFMLRLTGIDEGRDAWLKLLRGHWEGCETSP
jgi:hypothetical protein